MSGKAKLKKQPKRKGVNSSDVAKAIEAIPKNGNKRSKVNNDKYEAIALEIEAANKTEDPTATMMGEETKSLNDYSLAELRQMYPSIKARSIGDFINKLNETNV